MRKCKFLAVAFVTTFVSILCTSSAFAQGGGPPMLTDDSGTPGDGKWENNFAFLYNGSKNDNTKNFPIADLNYGVGDRIQLKVEFAWVAGKGEPLAGKFDYISPGVKYRFLDEKENGVSVSTFPSLNVSFQPEDKNRSVEYGFFLPLEISKEFFGLTFDAQAGYKITGAQSGWAFGAVISREFAPSATMLLELHTDLSKSENEPSFDTQTFLDLGAQINISDTYTLLAAIGKDIISPSFSSSDANFYGYFGLQLHL